MTFKDFKTEIEELAKDSKFYDQYDANAYVDQESRYRRWGDDRTIVTEPRLLVVWETGGVSGGSCWESSNPRSYTNDTKEPELEILDEIINKFIPSLSYIQFKKLYSELINRSEFTDMEYYGNQTDYDVKYIRLVKLFNYMKEQNYLED